MNNRKPNDLALLTLLEKALQRREALKCSQTTNTYRLFWGDYEGIPGIIFDRYGDSVLCLYTPEVFVASCQFLANWLWKEQGWNCFGKKRAKRNQEEVALWFGSNPTENRFVVRENDKKFWICFSEGFSTGLFLDFREQREKIPKQTGRFLNLFAYTCSFSVYAARQGFQTWSVDLSSKYLQWGKENFRLNALPSNDPEHYFFAMDVRESLKRFKKKGILFDYIVMDPPSFSTGKKGVFSVKQHLPLFVNEACHLLNENGTLQISTNLEQWSRPDFQAEMRKSIAPRKILSETWFEPPVDFPAPRSQFHLKCLTYQLA